MTATIGSRYCKTLTSSSIYAPFPDDIEVIISIYATYPTAASAKISVTTDYSPSSSMTVSLSSGKATAGFSPLNPDDYILHSFQMVITYYNSSGTVLGSENAVNIYDASSTTYHMQGKMGTCSVTEDAFISKTYPEVVAKSSDETWTVQWQIHPEKSSSNPASAVLIKPYFKYSSMSAFQEITDTIAETSSYISRWNIDGDKYQIALGIPGIYALKIEFYYYKGDRSSSLQYIVHTFSCTRNFTVYELYTPSFEISSITPAKYSQDSTDPLEGKAPYSVVWHDTTKELHPYGIPQSRILWCFGDAASGKSNYLLQINGTGKMVTAEDQTHSYPDYERYTVTLKVTDGNGNVMTGSNSFQGSTSPRQFSSPSLVKRGTYAPVLLMGTADVAGVPTPSPVWTYTLDGETAYSGSVSGEYVEMSLLKGGTYTVTYKVTVGEIQKTTTWTFEVISRGIIEDDSVSMPSNALIVLDNSLKPVDFCLQHSSLQYIENYQDLDTFSFSIPLTYPYASFLQEGDLLLIGYLGKARLMMVTYRERDENSLTISGESAFPSRIALTATKSSANNGKDTQTCTAETLLRYFLISCLKDSYGTEPRQAAFDVFGEDLGRGGIITYSARFETLRDIMSEICKSSNLGFTICGRPTIGYAGMTIREGLDRTSGEFIVIFSPERLKNCVIESDSSSLSSNVAIGAGSGSGSSRQYSYYGETAKSGFNRREMFVDADDASSPEEVERMSLISLKEAKQLSIRIRVLPGCQWVFGTDYNVGDIIRLESPDRGFLELQIYAAESCRRSEGDELYLDLGYECATAPSLIRKVEKENTYGRK